MPLGWCLYLLVNKDSGLEGFVEVEERRNFATKKKVTICGVKMGCTKIGVQSRKKGKALCFGGQE